MSPPPLLKLASEAEYRSHYVNQLCKRVITTVDGMRVYFEKGTFRHAFFESPNRDGVKAKVMSPARVERMDWIEATLLDKGAQRFQGYIKKDRKYDPARRVDFVYEEFVVVLGIGATQAGVLKAEFITCYCADNSLGKILTSPLWTEAACRAALKI